jgi:hypothetical protein
VLKRALIASALCLAILPALSHAQTGPTPQIKPPKLTLKQKLKLAEEKMAMMAASHDKTMARMNQIGTSLDQLIKQVHGIRLKLEGK